MNLDPMPPDLVAPLRSAPPLRLSRWGLPFIRAISALALRQRILPGVSVRNAREGAARVRVYTPAAPPVGGLLWIHGGGLVIGRPEWTDARCARLARDLRVVVAAARYRLAPQNPFPAGLDDVQSAWGWLLQHAEGLGIAPERLAVGGESAGGGLAAALAQRLRDQGRPQPAAQLLIYPMLDDRTAARADIPPEAHEVWNNANNHFGWSSYLGAEPGGDAAPPYAVPARTADLSGLPPAWIGVGTRDLFLEEDRAYAHRLREAGVEVVLHEVPGAWHGFPAVAPEAETTRAFIAAQVAYLRDRIGA
ncbi:MAG: alpha/beta hydrolase [Alphaproteobacteria bacterium]|nr:alpha/beta hydrolase [Alphaproteobacteria bacterium]